MALSDPLPSAPATTTATSVTRGWRFVALAVVGVLAVGVGLAVGAYLLRPAETGAGFASAATYVPAGAAVYAELHLNPSAQQDGALRELLGRFPPIPGVELERPLVDDLTEQLDGMLGESGPFTWRDDVRPWFGGTVAFALIEFPPAAPMEMGQLPSFLLLFDATNPAAAGAAVSRMLQNTGQAATVNVLEHGDDTIVEFAGGAYAVTGDQLILALSADAIGGALDAHASGENLASSAALGEFVAALPEDRLMLAAYDLTGIASQAVGAGVPSAIGDAYAELMAGQSLIGAYALSAGGDRITMNVAGALPTGIFAPEAADRGLADEVPGDALLFADGGNLGQMWAETIAPLKDAAAESDPAIREQIETMESALGTDIEDFVAWIDDGALVGGWDGSQPYVGLILVPSDVIEAERRLGQLATFAELAALDSSSGISVTEREVAGETVTSINLLPGTQPPGMPIDFSTVVEYTVTEDRAVIAFGNSFVERVLQLDPADSLASEPRYADAVVELGGTTNTGVIWLDLTGAREAAEAAWSDELATPGGEMYGQVIRPWLLPLDRLVSVGLVEENMAVGDVVLLFK